MYATYMSACNACSSLECSTLKIAFWRNRDASEKSLVKVSQRPPIFSNEIGMDISCGQAHNSGTSNTRDVNTFLCTVTSRYCGGSRQSSGSSCIANWNTVDRRPHTGMFSTIRS